jgi:hypothetical protein
MSANRGRPQLRGCVSSQCQRGFAQRNLRSRAETPINPDTKVDGFPAPLQHEPRILMHGAVQMGWAETVAFGYLRERLVGTAGPQGTFGYPATCAVVKCQGDPSGGGSPALKGRSESGSAQAHDWPQRFRI